MPAPWDISAATSDGRSVIGRDDPWVGGMLTVAWPAMAGPVTDAVSDANGDRTAPKGESSKPRSVAEIGFVLSDGVWTSTSRRLSWRRGGGLPATKGRVGGAGGGPPPRT